MATWSSSGSMSDPAARRRYYGFDVLRGLSIFLMVAYHFGFDLVSYGLLPRQVLFNPLLNGLQVFFASVFVAISGASSTFSHNNVRRGIKLLLCALVVSLATYVAMPSEFIRFGILHFLGCAALLYALLRPLLEKVPLHPLACLLLFFLFRWLLSPTYDIPYLWWLGIRQPSFSSGDYFPLLPWFFMYLFGVWLGRAAAAEKLPAWFYRLRCPFLEKVGSHTLWIYLLHQPVCLGLTLLLVRLLG